MRPEVRFPQLTSPVLTSPERWLLAWRRAGRTGRIAMALGALLALVLFWRGLTAPSLAATDPTGDAGWVVYASGGDLYATDGSERVALTQNGVSSDPAWTADGLLFVERERNSSDVWKLAGDGGPVRLTRSSSPVVALNHWTAQPVPGPAGDAIYVLSDHDKTTTGPGNLAIWRLDPRSGALQQVTRPPAYGGGDQDVTVDPADPSVLVFTRYAYADEGQLTERLMWLDTRTGRLVALTGPDSHTRQATFAPDGSHLAFVQTTDSDEDLYVARIDAEDGTPKLADVELVAEGTIAQPSWSGDGSRLAYQSLRSRRFELWVAPASSGDDGSISIGSPVRLVDDQSLDATSRPVWVPWADAGRLGLGG